MPKVIADPSLRVSSDKRSRTKIYHRGDDIVSATLKIVKIERDGDERSQGILYSVLFRFQRGQSI